MYSYFVLSGTVIEMIYIYSNFIFSLCITCHVLLLSPLRMIPFFFFFGLHDFFSKLHFSLHSIKISILLVVTINIQMNI